MNPAGRCGVCGLLLMGVATAHVCTERAHVEARRPEAIVLRTPYVFGSHEDRAPESVVDLEMFSRRVFPGATAYGTLESPSQDFSAMLIARWLAQQRFASCGRHAQQLINQSGMDSTLPIVPGTDKETL